MSSNVGLSTPRGSGTSGYVQRNVAHLRPRDHYPAGGGGGGGAPYPSSKDQQDRMRSQRLRQPDRDILEHQRRREIEVKILELRDELEEEGSLDEDTIDARCASLRASLENPTAAQNPQKRPQQKPSTTTTTTTNNNNPAAPRPRPTYKSHQVHEIAQAKLAETENLRRALGISPQYEEGSHWRKREERERERESRSGREEGRERDGDGDRDRD